MQKTVHKLDKGLKGEIKIPGDKSISHRAVILGSIAQGKTEISNFLDGADCLCTRKAFESLGVKVEELDNGKKLIIHGQGLAGLQQASQDQKATEIYLGNSGTSARLLTGLFSGLPFANKITGDESLSKRPMKRVIEPLSLMGAEIESKDGLLPLITNPVGKSKKLKGINYKSPIASAQVKSSLLLAGLNAEGETIISEPHKSRDHTELMLKAFGAELSVLKDDSSEYSVSLKPLKQDLSAQKIEVPSDISAAAFFMVAASIVPGSEITLKNIGINPTRTGIIDAMKSMGADLEIINERKATGEVVADIIIRSSVDSNSGTLKGANIDGSLIPSLIDEIPIIAILAAQADGKTVIKDAQELRVKESDRIKTTINMLRALGVDVEEKEDGMIIKGRAGKAFDPKAEKLSIDSHGDHRIAMSSAIAALHCNCPIEILQAEFVATSFPRFFDVL